MAPLSGAQKLGQPVALFVKPPLAEARASMLNRLAIVAPAFGRRGEQVEVTTPASEVAMTFRLYCGRKSASHTHLMSNFPGNPQAAPVAKYSLNVEIFFQTEYPCSQIGATPAGSPRELMGFTAARMKVRRIGASCSSTRRGLDVRPGLERRDEG
jgi:hypothetical protein